MNKILLARYRALAARAIKYILANGRSLSQMYAAAGARDAPALHAAGDANAWDEYTIANARLASVDTALLHTSSELSAFANGALQEPEDVIMRSVTVLRHIASGITYGIVWGRGASVTTYMYRADARSAGAEHGGGHSITTDLHKAAPNIAGIVHGGGHEETEDINVAGARTADAIDTYGQAITALLSKASPGIEDLQAILMATICYTVCVAHATTLTPDELLMTTSGELFTTASPDVQEPESILARSITQAVANAGAVLVDYRIDAGGLASAYLIANASLRTADVIHAAGSSTTTMTSQAGACLIEWEYPVLADNVLTVTQVYEATQNGNILEVT